MQQTRRIPPRAPRKAIPQSTATVLRRVQPWSLRTCGLPPISRRSQGTSIALCEPVERELVGGTPPSGFRLGEHAGCLTGGELEDVVEADIARLEHPTQITGREFALDPVTERKDRSARPRQRSWQPRPDGHRPVVSQRFLPDQWRIGFGCARNLDLIQRDAGLKNSAKYLLNLGIATARVKEVDCRGWLSFLCARCQQVTSETPANDFVRLVKRARRSLIQPARNFCGR